MGNAEKIRILRSALEALVELKRYKTIYGKDCHYTAWQMEGWEKAQKALDETREECDVGFKHIMKDWYKKPEIDSDIEGEKI